MPEKTDLRALIADRKSKEDRGTVRQRFCLQPDLLPELNELIAERDASLAADKPLSDVRMGGDPLSRRISQLEKEVTAVSITAVFRVPTRLRWAEYLEGSKGGADIDIQIALECFVWFERDGQRVPDTELGAGDWKDLVEITPKGEIDQVGSRIAIRTAGSPDFPASLKQSGQTRK